MRRTLTALFLAALLAACGDSEDGATTAGSGVDGHVVLGPTCPVEMHNEPCEDAPAADVPVAVHEPSPSDPMTPGRVVEETATDEDGDFRIDLEPGAYLVTAEAGMSCEVVPVNVVEDVYVDLVVPCDTGIR